MEMTRAESIRWRLTAVAAACLGLLACDELQGVYRSHTVKGTLSADCVRTALEALPGEIQSSEASRWHLRMPGNDDNGLNPSVVLERRKGNTELTVFVQRLVPSKGRYSAAELVTAEKVTAEVMRAVAVACMPSAETVSSTCEIKGRDSRKCQAEGQ